MSIKNEKKTKNSQVEEINLDDFELNESEEREEKNTKIRENDYETESDTEIDVDIEEDGIVDDDFEDLFDIKQERITTTSSGEEIAFSLQKEKGL